MVVIAGTVVGMHQLSLRNAQSTQETINTLHNQAVADLVKGNAAAATSRYDAVIAKKKGTEKATYLSERASVLFDYDPDGSKSQILADAYAAEKLNPNASNAYFIYTIETYYHNAAQADTYLKYYQERVDTNEPTE
jgi:hypothetical protein